MIKKVVTLHATLLLKSDLCLSNKMVKVRKYERTRAMRIKKKNISDNKRNKKNVMEVELDSSYSYKW